MTKRQLHFAHHRKRGRKLFLWSIYKIAQMVNKMILYIMANLIGLKATEICTKDQSNQPATLEGLKVKPHKRN